MLVSAQNVKFMSGYQETSLGFFSPIILIYSYLVLFVLTTPFSIHKSLTANITALQIETMRVASLHLGNKYMIEVKNQRG